MNCVSDIFFETNFDQLLLFPLGLEIAESVYSG